MGVIDLVAFLDLGPGILNAGLSILYVGIAVLLDLHLDLLLKGVLSSGYGSPLTRVFISAVFAGSGSGFTVDSLLKGVFIFAVFSGSGSRFSVYFLLKGVFISAVFLGSGSFSGSGSNLTLLLMPQLDRLHQ